MRNPARISLALGTSAALLSLAALPASAAEDESNATIEVQAGSLGIVVSPALEAAKMTPGAEATFAVPGVAVTDNRATQVAWAASVSMTDFTAAALPDAKPIPAAGAAYTVAPETLLSTGTIKDLASTAVTWTAAGEEMVAVSAASVLGNNTASWNGTLTVPVPADALAGEYSATLTHSVL